MVNCLSRLMPNVGGPSAAKRRLLMSATMSRLLHLALIWSPEGLKTAHNRLTLTRPQRQAALRIARCYNSVSNVATFMLAETPPADLLVAEIVRIKFRLAEDPTVSKSKLKNEERLVTLNIWKSR